MFLSYHVLFGCFMHSLASRHSYLASAKTGKAVLSNTHIGSHLRMYHPSSLQPFNGLFSRTTWVSRYQKGKTNLDFTGARDSEWQWHQLGHMQVCTLLQTDNRASTPPLCFLQAGCPSCRPTNSVKALKASIVILYIYECHPLNLCPFVSYSSTLPLSLFGITVPI